jgi:ABC-type Mn2+/Zn2+ transport system ATPase subunit
VGFKDADFTWSVRDGTSSPSSRNFALHIDGQLVFPQGGLSLVVGPTGSGKTSLLMALLGEMYFVPSKPDGWMNLPRNRGVAFAAQESWVQNETIRVRSLFFGLLRCIECHDKEKYSVWFTI